MQLCREGKKLKRSGGGGVCSVGRNNLCASTCEVEPQKHVHQLLPPRDGYLCVALPFRTSSII